MISYSKIFKRWRRKNTNVFNTWNLNSYISLNHAEALSSDRRRSIFILWFRKIMLDNPWKSTDSIFIWIIKSYFLWKVNKKYKYSLKCRLPVWLTFYCYTAIIQQTGTVLCKKKKKKCLMHTYRQTCTSTNSESI